MLDQLQGLHIEPTNMCTLKCPRCSRTQFIERFPKRWKNYSLGLEQLKSFLDIPLDNKSIHLCGNYGDPIYYEQLIDMVEFFKNKNSNVFITTNGSYKSLDWWSELATNLDVNDTVYFSIDGTPENFTQYRINADWPSVQQGIETLVKYGIKVVWKYIPFSFNEHDIDATRKIAEELGVVEFIVTPSSRWNSEDDYLRPTTYYSDKEITWHASTNREVDPICKNTNEEHFISANGYYTPCCKIWDHSFYYKTDFYKNKDLYDISKTTLSQILTSKQVIDFYSNLEDAKLNYCTLHCPKL